MDTLPLPPRPDLDNYRKRAKSLAAAAGSRDPDALQRWATDWLSSLTRALGWELTPFIQDSFDRAVERLTGEVRARRTRAHETGGSFGLSDAQHLIAQAHGFETWAGFSAHVQGLTAVDPRYADFEAAADAVVNGNLVRLDELLVKNPALDRARSHRRHHATLLHYVAANGVEDFRQKTPPNATAIATRLLDAGAEVDALAETYGGGTFQTTLNLLVSSVHPHDAGLQETLAELLVERGAAIDGLANDSSPVLTALSFGYPTTAEALVRRGARISNVVIAASLGKLDLVRGWVVDRHTLTHQEPLNVPYWVHIPADAPGQIARAMVVACRFRQPEVVKFLLELGVDPASADHDNMTALHWASASGLQDVMAELIDRGAPLEVRNAWGGTVLDSTVWFAANAPNPGVNYPSVIELLLAAGADPREVNPFPTGLAPIDAVVSRFLDREH